MGNIQQQGNPGQWQQAGCNDCEEKNKEIKDFATQKNIIRERQAVCDALFTSSGETKQQEAKFDGENELYEKKKCMFIHTEENYQRFRNLDMTACEEITQTNDSVKESYKALSEWNK